MAKPLPGSTPGAFRSGLSGRIGLAGVANGSGRKGAGSGRADAGGRAGTAARGCTSMEAPDTGPRGDRPPDHSPADPGA